MRVAVTQRFPSKTRSVLLMKRFWTFSKSVRQIAVIALTFVWLPCSVLAAESYYVAKNGADTNPGTLQQPWLTIQHAANVATPGSTVYVRAGTYQERVNINVSGNSQDGYITFCNYAGSVGGSDHCTIVNNTLYMNDSTQSGSGEFSINYHTTNNLFENNIVYSNDQGLMIGNSIRTASGPGVLTNYNLYYSTVGNSKAQWIWNNHTYKGLAAFVEATQDDLNSQFVDPDFVDLSTDNFRLSSASPALKKGLLLSSSIVGTTDLDGNPRILNNTIDLGCYEMPQ